VAIGKTLFIEEELAQALRKLACCTEQRFLSFEQGLHRAEPVSPEEHDELVRIRSFLHAVGSWLPEKGSLQDNDKDVLRAVEKSLREITDLSHEFHNVELEQAELAKRVAENEISGLLRKVYLDAMPYSSRLPALVYKITRGQLKRLVREARKLNACRDTDYKVVWHRWWRNWQRPEFDTATGIREPHVNATVKLFGGPKKDIHLLIA
jgi:hypothetical protein